MVLLQKSKKLENVLKKRYGPSEKSYKLKNVLEKRYGRIGTYNWNNRDLEGLRINRAWPVTTLKLTVTTLK